MEGIKWPAVAIQGIFLAANISFFLSGMHNTCIIISLTLLIFLFMIQSFSRNPRFLYLFPVIRKPNVPDIPVPSIDTWILKGILIGSIFFFYLGAYGSIRLTLMVLVLGILFPLIWDRYIEPYNQRRIVDTINNRNKT